MHWQLSLSRLSGDGKPIEPLADPALKSLLWGCVLCNDAVLQYTDNQWQILGDPAEGALLVLAHKAGIEATAENYPRVQEYPFDSDRQRMSIICEQSSYYLLFAKGSPESILDRSTHTLVEDRYVELTKNEQQKIRSQNASLASQGLRVLGFAYRYFPHLPDADEAESELIWVGLVGMLDAPRPEVRAAVDTCKTAEIRTMMITGDHPLTADVMQRPPFQPSESIFARGLGAYIIRIGLVFGVVTIGLMKWAFVGVGEAFASAKASPIGELDSYSRLCWV